MSYIVRPAEIVSTREPTYPLTPRVNPVPRTYENKGETQERRRESDMLRIVGGSRISSAISPASTGYTSTTLYDSFGNSYSTGETRGQYVDKAA